MPNDSGLRVKLVANAPENYIHAPLESTIERNPEHGGLRVREVAPAGTPLVASHPAAVLATATHNAMAALGNPKTGSDENLS